MDLCEKLSLLLTLVDRFGEARRRPSPASPGCSLRTRCGPHGCSTHWAISSSRTTTSTPHWPPAHAVDELIGPCGVNDDRERVDLWVHMQTNIEFSVHFWRNELERAAAVIESVRPLVETTCGPEVVACFHIALAQQHVRERRYRVDAQVLEEHRRSVDAARAPGTGHDNGAQRGPAVLHTEQPRRGADLARKSR